LGVAVSAAPNVFSLPHRQRLFPNRPVDRPCDGGVAMVSPKTLKFDTLSLHAGQEPDPTTGSRAVPIHQTTSYVFSGVDQAAELFNLERPGHIYSRISNPTVAVLEKRLSALEGGVGAVCTSSGQAALHLAIATLMGAGGHIVSSASIYGGSHNMFTHTLPRFGIETTFVDPRDPAAFIMRARAEGLRDFGACMSPANAFYLIQGVETLPLRMKKHSANALVIAEFLEAQDAVEQVNYPGLASHPDHNLAGHLMPDGHGGILSFELADGRAGCRRFIEKLNVFSHLANVGDAKSLVIHPASTTHQQMDADALAVAGIGEGMVRLSVGLEDPSDLIGDLKVGLRAAAKG